MESLRIMVQEAKVVVGLDFGTTFSGFAYALRADPDKVYTFYDWPMQAEGGGLPYCKTQTSLLYADASDASEFGPFELREWGWPAFVKYKSVADHSSSTSSVIRNLDALTLSSRGSKKLPVSQSSRSQSSGGEHFLSLFKLHLATEDSTGTICAPALPPGMTAKRAIVDFLSQISKFILQEVRNKFGSHISLDGIEWCLTVPAIWDEQAKREMRDCSEIAGLVQGPQSKGTGSPHPLKLFIEPEAASIYCQLKLKDHAWRKGDKFLVVDCGGGTVDLVLHEKLGDAPSVSVREVEESSGALCGGSRVDEEFFSFLRRRISCSTRFEREYPEIVLAFRQDWERIKYDYAGENGDVHIVELPPKLAAMWEEEDAIPIHFSRRINSNICSYDELELTNEDMKSIFDPVVNRILHLVEERMVSGLHAILVVGGFSASPYLMRLMREAFGGRVAAIASPPYPGSAVCCGAVTMGIRSDTVASRISKRTYGIRVMTPFISGVHPLCSKTAGDYTGEVYSRNGFLEYVRKGAEIPINDFVKDSLVPINRKQTMIASDLYSSDREDAKHVTDPGMRLEGTFTIECPSYFALGFQPKVEVSMFFGRTEIQVTAVGTNFHSPKEQMLPVKFEKTEIF